MIRRFAVAALLLAGALNGQDKTKAKAKAEHYDFHPLMTQIWEAWSTLNPDNAARFYSKDAERTFFDLAPLKYTGWTEYAAGVKKVFADYSSAKFVLTGTSHVAQRPTIAWATATGHGVMNKKTGAKEELDFRWTVLWEKSGDDWLIIHEHVSTPMAAARPAVVPPVTTAKPATAPKK
jgi:ketosteroid isomerase-like protein